MDRLAGNRTTDPPLNGHHSPTHRRPLYGARSTLPPTDGRQSHQRLRGIPTANLPVDDNLTPWLANIKPGVYFGWASLRLSSSHPNQTATPSSNDSTTTTTTGFSVYPMVMSIGRNQFYENTEPSAEVHVLHEFAADFYGVEMRLLITGLIREMRDYAELEGLIEDIKVDCEVARRSLDREAWALRETGKGTLDGSWLVRE
ncbi:riboflavin kinase [Auriscalpium vulgare]|uniref:Riboflavin kinase n=1 Tax=Auriscalpium vulgare TaxID=40419 RepID=A0ACB8RDY0_9AGAM|nr:riboflavin kinase [Auriscalpium vulgare]